MSAQYEYWIDYFEVNSGKNVHESFPFESDAANRLKVILGAVCATNVKGTMQDVNGKLYGLPGHMDDPTEGCVYVRDIDISKATISDGEANRQARNFDSYSLDAKLALSGIYLPQSATDIAFGYTPIPNPHQGNGSSAPVPLPVQPAQAPVILPTPVQGNDSSGQLPWNVQPDIGNDIAPGVVVQNLDQGGDYVKTLSMQYGGPAFLAWLVLKVPDAKTYNSLTSPGGTDGKGNDISYYLNKWSVENEIQYPIPAILPSPRIPDLPTTQVPATLQSPPQTGTGILTNAPIDNTTMQSEQFLPVPIAPDQNPASDNTPIDYLSLMYGLKADDFLNVLGNMYHDTLGQIAADPVARNTLNKLAQTHDPDLESFIRLYVSPKSEAPLSSLPSTQVPALQKIASLALSESSTSWLIIIVLAVVSVVFYLYKKGKLK